MRLAHTFLLGTLLGLFSLFIVGLVNAQSMEPSASPSASVVDSYSLLWPLSAGKTEGESFYFLKLLKEKLSGLFIFDDSKKADYEILIGTKRVLEAEKLLKDGNTTAASKTLENARSEYTSALNHLKKAHSKNKLLTGEIRRDRLIYIKSIIDQMKLTAPQEVQESLDGVKENADAMLRDYLP